MFEQNKCLCIKNDDIRLWLWELMIHLTFIVHADYHSPLIPCRRSAGHLYCPHPHSWKYPINSLLAPSSFVLPPTTSFATSTHKRMSSIFAWGANQLLGCSGPVMINVCRALTYYQFLSSPSLKSYPNFTYLLALTACACWQLREHWLVNHPLQKLL